MASLVGGGNELVARPTIVAALKIEHRDRFDLLATHRLSGARFNPLRDETLAQAGYFRMDAGLDEHALVEVGEAPRGLFAQKSRSDFLEIAALGQRLDHALGFRNGRIRRKHQRGIPRLGSE